MCKQYNVETERAKFPSKFYPIKSDQDFFHGSQLILDLHSLHVIHDTVTVSVFFFFFPSDLRDFDREENVSFTRVSTHGIQT